MQEECITGNAGWDFASRVDAALRELGNFPITEIFVEGSEERHLECARKMYGAEAVKVALKKLDRRKGERAVNATPKQSNGRKRKATRPAVP